MGNVLARTVRSELATWLMATFAIFVTGAVFLVSWDLKESRAPPVVIAVDSSPQGELVRDIAVVNSFAGVAYIPAAVCAGMPPQSALYAPIGESSADFLQMTRAVIMPLAKGEVSSLGLVQSVPPEFSGGDTAASAAMRPSPILPTQGILPIAS